MLPLCPTFVLIKITLSFCLDITPAPINQYPYNPKNEPLLYQFTIHSPFFILSLIPSIISYPLIYPL